jgi:hypothetical protein
MKNIFCCAVFVNVITLYFTHDSQILGVPHLTPPHFALIEVQGTRITEAVYKISNDSFKTENVK